MFRKFVNGNSRDKCLHSLIILIASFSIGSFTDIEESSLLVDESLGFKVHIPVLSCFVKYTGYSRIIWYKDGINVDNGSSYPAAHLFSVASLLNNPRFKNFKNPLQLQGYYWCETNAPHTDALEHKYLFQIENVNTYLGSFLATEDSLGTNKKPSAIDKTIDVKKEIYSFEIQETLFGFLRPPNTFVVDIKSAKKGLEIDFYLYVVQSLDGRLQGDPRLIRDEHILHDLEDYLRNRTETDPDLYYSMLEWADFRGIDIDKISFKSTIGCYVSKTQNKAKSSDEITWPYTYLQDVAISEESCTTKSGLPVTRQCMGSYTEGASWGAVDGICVNEPTDLSKSLKTFAKNLKKLSLSDSLKTLGDLIAKESNLSASDLILVADILETLTYSTNFESEVSDVIFLLIDVMLNSDASTINVAKDRLQFTNRILEIVNNVIERGNVEHVMLEVSSSTMLLFTKDTDFGDKHVNGGFVTTPSLNSTLEESTIVFLINGTSFPYSESQVGFLLPTELIIKRESEFLFPCQLNMLYFKDWKLFPDPPLAADATNLDIIPTPVMLIAISGGPAWNLVDPVQIFFKNNFQGFADKPTCVYFDSKRGDKGSWATEGCSYEGLKNGYHICHCHHLSIFSIILPQPHQTVYRAAIFSSHLSLYVGCGVSIIVLAFAVLFYMLSKAWRQTIDHDALFHLALSFLCSLIVLVVHEKNTKWESGCLLLSHIFYYYVLVMCCWLFIQSIVHYIRFSKKAETGDISHFYVKCIFFSWGFPLLAMAIIGISKKYGYYEKNSCWPTLEEVSRVAFIPIVIILNLAMCFNLNAAYSISCRYKKDLLVGTQKYKEDALKFRVAITLFVLIVLSWMFGYLSLWNQRMEMQILFSIFIIVSSLYVTLFFIFHEFSVDDILRKPKNDISEPIAAPNAYNNQTYDSIAH